MLIQQLQFTGAAMKDALSIERNCSFDVLPPENVRVLPSIYTHTTTSRAYNRVSKTYTHYPTSIQIVQRGDCPNR